MINPITEKCRLSKEFAGDIYLTSMACGHQSVLEEVVPKLGAEEEKKYPEVSSIPERNKGRKKTQKECPAEESQRDYGEIFQNIQPLVTKGLQ